jgi:hypothetical protein
VEISATRVLDFSIADVKHVRHTVRLKCDGTRGKPRFLLSAKRTSPFKSVGASVQWTPGSRGVRISGSNAGYTMFRGSVKSTGYPIHSPVSPSLPLPCVTVCHHISTGLYQCNATSSPAWCCHNVCTGYNTVIQTSYETGL